jgi:periplasmic divalent cation tolerance protein
MNSAYVIVLSTVPDDSEATALARMLVEERLVACVNVLPLMRSIYRWQGAVEEANERQLVMKTAAVRVEALKARLIALHRYDVPEFLVLPVVDGTERYLAWIEESTSPPR